MRQQYHSRKTDDGLYIWDVHKLVEQSKALPIVDVPLSDIKELDENYWFDGDWPVLNVRNIAVHAMLIEQCNLDYPIILDSQGRIMDGMHRCCRALIDNQKTIKAVQFEEDPEPHYIDVPIETLPHDDPVEL